MGKREGEGVQSFIIRLLAAMMNRVTQFALACLHLYMKLYSRDGASTEDDPK